MKPLAATRKKGDFPKVRKEIQAIAKTISENTLVVKIYLVGSALSEDTFTNFSDIDLVIICKNSEDLKKSQKSLGPHYPLSWDYAVDLVWMLQSEFERKSEIGGIAMIAADSGKLLFEREFLNDPRKTF